MVCRSKPARKGFARPGNPTTENRNVKVKTMRQSSLSITAFLLCSSLALAAEPAAPAAPASSPAGKSPSVKLDLSVYPEQITLDTARDFQSFIAVVRREDDVTMDVTETAKWTLADSKSAKIDGQKIVPVADGETELICNYGSSEIRVPVKVTRSGEKHPISFEKDIVPVLTRSGCNTGSCHGAARGKDGFMLSLFGYDPAGDYKRITREIGMRRINLAVPEESLFLTKSTGAVTHTGGKLFGKDSVYYRTILEWLENGAPVDPTPPPAVVDLKIYPPQSVIEGQGSKQKFIAVAHYADGTTRDVSNLAAFMTNNETSAQIDKDGNVVVGARGRSLHYGSLHDKNRGSASPRSS